MFNEYEVSERIKERRTTRRNYGGWTERDLSQKTEISSGYVPLRRKALETIMKLTKKKGAMRNV